MSDMKPLFELSEEIERKYRSKLNSDFMDERFYDEKNRERRDGQFQRDY